MIDIVKEAEAVSKQSFLGLGFDQIKIIGIDFFIRETNYGFESIATSQIQTDFQKQEFWTSVFMYRRLDIVECPLSSIFINYSNLPLEYAPTLNFRYRTSTDLKSKSLQPLKFEISEIGLNQFGSFIAKNFKNVTDFADRYLDIRVLDAIINKEYELTDFSKDILVENIPRIFKRLVIAKLAGNLKWKLFYEKSLAGFYKAIEEETSPSFVKIFEDRITTLNNIYDILQSIEEIKGGNQIFHPA